MIQKKTGSIYKKLDSLCSFVLSAVFFIVMVIATGFLVLIAYKPVHAEVREFTLTVTEGAIDLGGTQLMGWKYNGTVPGPEIRVKEGDTVRIKLKNMSGAKHAMFFHGIHVPPKVSMQEEVPVDPGYEYTYEFEAKPAGTHLYHCGWNMAEHLSMGLYGAIIVEGKEDKKYDMEFVYILNDWSSKAARGEGRHEMGHPRTLMDNDITTINDTVVKGDNTLTMEVKKGENIRLRLANIGHLPHTLRFPDGFAVTHEDGYPVPKIEKKDELVIYPGKRYDIVVKAEKIGDFAFYHSVTMPKGVWEVLMGQAGHKSSGQTNGMTMSAPRKEDGKKAMHMAEEEDSMKMGMEMDSMKMGADKEVPILTLKVKGVM